MKKQIALLLVYSMLFSLFTLNGYAAKIEASEKMKANILAADADQRFTIQQAEEQVILSKFASEVRHVEEKYNVRITELNEKNLDLLKQEAILGLRNGNYRFANLVDEIAVACARSRLQNADGVTVTEFRPFGPLRGKHFVNVATGTTTAVEDNVSIGISVGEELFGVTLNAGVSKSVSYSCTGPADGTTLNNGVAATHRTAFGVLYGTIMKREARLSTGELWVTYFVEEISKDAESFTTLTKIGVPTYANILSGSVMYFSDQRSLYAMIEDLPDRLL